MNTDNNKIIFLGTPEFALPSLQALIAHNFKPLLVITQPDQPLGRNRQKTAPPVKLLAQKNNLAVSQPKNKQELKEIFLKNDCDLAVLVAYGMIIPLEILTKPRSGFLNLHPSLLPKYRGAAPIQNSLLNGDDQTGISIIKLTPELDAGPIVATKKFKIKPDDNAQTLHDGLAKLGADLLVEIIPEYLAGRIKLVLQNDSQASYTKIITRDDGLANWQKSARQILNQFKAFTPWPGIFTYLAGKRLKILNLSVLEGVFKPNLAPGTLFLAGKQQLAVACGQDAIALELVQLEGKKPMSGSEFLRGQAKALGKILG